MANMCTPPNDYKEWMSETISTEGEWYLSVRWRYWYYDDPYERECGSGCDNVSVTVYDKKNVCRAEEIDVDKLNERNYKRVMEVVHEPEGD